MRFLFLIFSICSACSAATYYVSEDGSDDNDGLTISDAFATLQYAVSVVEPGDEVLVEDGTYTGFNIFKSGAADAPITFRALGEAAVIDEPNSFTTRDGINVEGGSWITIDGFRCLNLPRAGIRIVNGDHCIVRNTHCLDNGKWGIFTGHTDDFLVENNVCARSVDEHGIYISNSSDRSIVRNNVSFSNGGGGVQINADANFAGDGISSDAQIYNNVFYDNGARGGAAINLDGAVNALIVNNLLYENNAGGIALFRIDAATASKDAKVYHNVIINSSVGRNCLAVKNGATGADVRNNIIYTPRSNKGIYDIDSASLPGLLSDYNLIINRFYIDEILVDLDDWISQTGQDANSILIDDIDALFQDRSGSDYRLATNSPAINQAISLSSPLLEFDFEGNPRFQDSAPDIGPYEYPVFRLSPLALTPSNLSFELTNLEPGKIVYLQRSSNLSQWLNVASYQSDGESLTRSLLSGDFSPAISGFSVTENFTLSSPQDFFRLAVSENE